MDYSFSAIELTLHCFGLIFIIGELLDNCKYMGHGSHALIPACLVFHVYVLMYETMYDLGETYMVRHWELFTCSKNSSKNIVKVA